MALLAGVTLFVVECHKEDTSFKGAVFLAFGGMVGAVLACLLMNWFEARARARNRP